MFSQSELEALSLGARWVSTYADRPLAAGAREALAKIEAILPAALRDGARAAPLRVGPPAPEHAREEDLRDLREAIRHERKLKIGYLDRNGRESERTIWPFAIGYFSCARLLAAWCELRADYRHFRTEAIRGALVLPEAYPRRRMELLREWRSRELGSVRMQDSDV